MSFLRKYSTHIYLVLVLIAVFFLTRLVNIMSLPIFTDEAIYVRWSQIASQDSSWRFISLTDGKQPSFIWLSVFIMHFVSDPLLAGRLVSVFAGFLSMIGLFFLSSEIFKNIRIGYAASLLYIFYPFALVYDRMALYDSLVGAFTIWSLYLAVLLARRVRLDVSLLLGMIIGGGMLTKTNAFFSIPLLAPTLLLFNFKQKDWKTTLLKWVFYAFVATILAFGIYSILRLSPFFHIIEQKNATFAYPVSEWLQHPTRFFVGNLRGLFDWLLNYMSLPVIFLIIFSFVVDTKIIWQKFVKNLQLLSPFIFFSAVVYLVFLLGNFHKDRAPESLPFLTILLIVFSSFIAYKKEITGLFEKLLLVIWFGVPFVYLAFFGNAIYPRHVLFMTLFLLPLVAYSLVCITDYFQKPIIKVIISALLLALWIRADYFIIYNFSSAPIPNSDITQYSNDWPAGGGTSEVINFLEGQSHNQEIYVLTEGTFGSLPTNVVEIYLGENKNIEKRGIWPLPEKIPEDIERRALFQPVYFIQNQSQTPPPAWPLELIVEYKKGTGVASMRLYKVRAL